MINMLLTISKFKADYNAAVHVRVHVRVRVRTPNRLTTEHLHHQKKRRGKEICSASTGDTRRRLHTLLVIITCSN